MFAATIDTQRPADVTARRLRQNEDLPRKFDMGNDGRILQLRPRDRCCHKFRHRGQGDRVKIEQIALEVRVDELRIDRLRTAQTLHRYHLKIGNFTVAPLIDVIAITRILDFDCDAVCVSLDSKDARVFANRRAQDGNREGKFGAIVGKACIRRTVAHNHAGYAG
jgi:hypothetical protein